MQYDDEDLLISMTGYNTPKCQYGGVYDLPNQNRALCKGHIAMDLENDGSADSLLIVCLAGYTKGSIYVGEYFGYCPKNYLNNNNIDDNYSISIDTILNCQKYACPEPTSPEYQICEFKLKIPDRPVGSMTIEVKKVYG